MRLPRYQANIVRPGASPELVARRNFDDLSSVLEAAFTTIESTYQNLQKSVIPTADVVGHIRRNAPAHSVKWWGGKGDGTTDDSEALSDAIAGGADIDLGGATFRITTAVDFNVAGQTIRNGTLKFDGANTARLAEITANNVTFDRVTFDGNSRQPRSGLVYVDANAVRPRFLNCTFKSITGTRSGGTGKGSTLDQTCALLINPYGVTDFEVVNCKFQDLVKYNDGVNLLDDDTGLPVAATEGFGFIGGIYFLKEDLSTPSAAQPTPTRGLIHGCTFDTIKTILAASLSANDVARFDDGDAIRTNAHTMGAGGAERLDVEISDCTFIRCSKRAFKLRASGAVAHDCRIHAAGLDYGMVVGIDLVFNCSAHNIKIYASASKPVQNAVQWKPGGEAAQLETRIEGLEVSHCISGIGFFSDADATPLTNFTVRNALIKEATVYGIVGTSPSASTHSGLNFENIKIFGSGDVLQGISIGDAADGKAGVNLRNVYIQNGSVNLPGTDIDVKGLRIDITSSDYEGHTTSSQLCRIGSTTLTGYSNTDDLFINAANLDTAFLNATRTRMVVLVGDAATWKNIKIKVPEGLSQSYDHAEFYGDNFDVDGLTYDGPGYIFVGVSEASVGWEIKNAVRRGLGACGTAFLYTNNASTESGLFENVTDFRQTSEPSVSIIGGVGGFVAKNVSSRSSNAVIVQHGGLALTANINKFDGTVGGRHIQAQGSEASANDMELGTDGNAFTITGATTINRIATEGWTAGSEITLHFSSTPTVAHQGAATGGGLARINLAGSANFVATANSRIKLYYNGTDWWEIGRVLP